MISAILPCTEESAHVFKIRLLIPAKKVAILFMLLIIGEITIKRVSVLTLHRVDECDKTN